MVYQIKELAQLAGVSTRTLRYYDEIGLLTPSEVNEAGYRFYWNEEVDRLQQILFYKSLDIKLSEIKRIMMTPTYDIDVALEGHHQALKEKRDQLNVLIQTVENTILSRKGAYKMTQLEKFEGFKRKIMAENEENFGTEIREKYGEPMVEKSNEKFAKLSEADYNEMQSTEVAFVEMVKKVLLSQDVDSSEAKEAYNLHRKWLEYTWPAYNAEAHKGLADLYVSDDRFGAYYAEKVGEPAAEWIHKIIHKYA
ncbi:MerR family transcriptional regulator [Fusibacter tunisiensis]|uniref:DNA-binding transcriptional MerR regulator n=1 Tax=Fusibacter tunisiensis TaxID=1008308 RepID=A0ABS2MTH5_9FIRM|nr:MerR family transcriptional regulator [Fusibacter tunisiensis]MBM7562683.1 DNA-binding transcriptional MerR regulator [Fusibacter tunisiensis]